MRSPRARFVLACLLFAAWIGYLVYLALTSTRPVVVSRPQVLVTPLLVVAEVSSLDEPAVVKEVLFEGQGLNGPKPGDRIAVENLRDCGRPGRNPTPDWTGAGDYLLPLRPIREGAAYLVVEVPSPPGNPGGPRPTPRLYPATEEAIRQTRRIKEQ